LEVGPEGYLSAVTYPEAESYRFTYSDGLRRTLRDPGGNESRFDYDEAGRLRLDTNAAGGFKLQATALTENGVEVTVSTAEGRHSRYLLEEREVDGQLVVTMATTDAGRVTTQTLTDGRVVGFGLDDSGNLTSVTPPGRPAHAFTYTPVDLQESYAPPDVGSGSSATVYAYDLDKRRDLVTRPDGEVVDLEYLPDGRLDTITSSVGVLDLGYDPATGQLTTVTAPGGASVPL
jgi:YD repeat-containing protein